jgi:hypothetical protein
VGQIPECLGYIPWVAYWIRKKSGKLGRVLNRGNQGNPIKLTFTLDFAGGQRLAFAPNLGFLPHHFYGILCEADKRIHSFIFLYYLLRATSSPDKPFLATILPNYNGNCS